MVPFKRLNILILVAVVATGVNAKTSLKDLTSSTVASKVASEVPSSKPRIGGKIHTHAVGIGLGQTSLVNEFNDHADNAISPDLFYSYRASYSFDMLVNFHYSNHEFDGEKVKLSGLNFGIRGRIFQMDSFAPFVLTGLGFYMPQVTRRLSGSLVESNTRITFGYHLGTGVELELNNHYTVGILAHYHNPFDIKQVNAPEVEGSYFKLMLTGMYIF